SRMRHRFSGALLGRVASLLASVWKLAIPHFRSEDRRAGRLLLAAVIGLELAAVGITVLINQWNAPFYNALQDRSWNNFVHEVRCRRGPSCRPARLRRQSLSRPLPALSGARSSSQRCVTSDW